MNFNILKKKNGNNSKTITINEDGVIPYNKIKNQENVTFIVITKDETTLQKVITSIADFHNEHKTMKINVVISSDYLKLHKISGGTF